MQPDVEPPPAALRRPLRILHFSDIHLKLNLFHMPLHKWFGKRSIGAVNLMSGRGRRFDEAEEKVAALAGFARRQEVDLVICTGDYTALGLEHELERARRVVAPLMRAPSGFVTVPGNHDIYVTDVVRQRRFLRHFADVLVSDLPDLCSDGPWPLVRLIGDRLAVVAVNSARPNPRPWRSNGRIPEAQLQALERILADRRLDGRFVFVITHYAPLLRDGRPDTPLHGMVNGDEFLAACHGLKRGAILCGHVHRRYHVAVDGVAGGLYCAGTATMAGREGFWLFELDHQGGLRALPGEWDGEGYRVLDPQPAAAGA
ncbi:MAG TPA: metallophosphoesterase [Sedimenticola thiotaurini]|uniref:Metallophosphoesterase n=1 Tax=Sedimenticola thiotaurini TaxID=1543721 RepID=A0A831RLD6_9GAMM|nr:metallophosphoesterase [Sedimenticola thiotaurini]